MGKDEEICGEPNPGFSLWTTAHGFHHYRFNFKTYKRQVRCCLSVRNSVHMSHTFDLELLSLYT